MDTAQEALFRAMLQDGWLTDSTGDVEAPTGYFGYVSNTIHELAEIREAFEDIINSYGDPEDSEIEGHYVITLTSAGIIHIHKHNTSRGAYETYKTLESEYNQWTSATESEV
ncbi:hypothetical protein PBI_DAMIEN_48 [Mycobacterium phage Damien]|uniref:hypothetical protein n=1 Tax=Mycobacterium phage Oaker TaxID=1445727 RepID=UPI0003E3BB3C|nr:hypothetical protein CH12_gp47 [Mycobacterium phage Oaker]YP_009044037.1 hypothetical protein HL12_gp48 [Mycobacterium phage Damien]AVO26025.1 hypothetical protein SEA_THUMB_48 [Mycobacterium phage Thumb]AXH47173.1 hypothetical protein SEA_CBORCH11_49 [Mycobacterium phage Cborch11]AHG24438.1 hypothetical protein PBI_OAKER_47 [Mycobacterium phage Oaker]AHZ95409.1 hypothetical protein PBI_DAMIEN_48 [Mycobacterium phage Damien]